jgi:uncharacterized protein
MIEVILEELKRLEKQKSIKILYAVESGSRAWGFASNDSDWDVRFIYVHQLDWYLSIEEKKDSFEEILSNDIDLAGWEIRKALRLLNKSNPSIMEWLNSPIIYLEQTDFSTRARQLASIYFNPQSCLYHYLSMAINTYKEYLLKDSVLVKKYFYVLRPLLACAWIEKFNAMAPMEFQLMLDTLIEDGELRQTILKLLKRKMNGDELDREPKIAIINQYAEKQIDHFSHYLKGFNFKNQKDTNELNQLFRNILRDAWN